MEETSKYGVLGQHQLCSEERIEVLSNKIERYHSPNLLYPESCSDGNWRSHIRKGICVTSASFKDFLETWLDERFWVQKLLDNQKERLLDKHNVPNQANQIQTQIMIERGNMLLAFKEERSILRKSKHVLFVKKLWNTIERWNLLFAVMKITNAQLLSAQSKHLIHVSLVKVRT